MLLLLAAVYLFGEYVLAPLSWSARRVSGGNDIGTPWAACVAYALDHEGFLPPLDTEPGRLIFDRNIMHDKYGITGKDATMEYDERAPVSWLEYDKDPCLEDNKDFIDDHSWWYLGYAITDEAQGLVFLKAYLDQVLANTSFNEQDARAGNDAGIHRLQIPSSLLAGFRSKTGVSDNVLAQIPVFVERPGHYRGYSGGWVTYMDGHREFMDFPGDFPMSERFISMLRLIDDIGPILRP